MTGPREDAEALTEDQALELKAQVMTLEYSGGLWVCAEDYVAQAAMIRAQLAELDALRAERDAADQRAGAMLARVAALSADAEAARSAVVTERTAREAAEARLAAVEGEIVRLRDLIRWAHDTLWELNPSNYDHDEVCKANDAAVEVIFGLAPVIGETHGYSPEWWDARAALTATPATQP